MHHHQEIVFHVFVVHGCVALLLWMNQQRRCLLRLVDEAEAFGGKRRAVGSLMQMKSKLTTIPPEEIQMRMFICDFYFP